MTEDELDPRDVAAALHSSVSLLLRRLRQSPVAGEPTLPERSALARLDRQGPATSAELARAEQISPQSMGATTAALETRGLVERRADPQDGRRALLSISEAGREVLRTKRDARTQQLARALEAEFTPAEIGRLMAAAPLLERLAQSV